MMSKKADISGMKFLLYIAYSFMIAFGFLGFVGTISAMSNRTNIVPESVEPRLVLERIFSSPACFAYQDETGRSYDIIDFNKFKTERLEHCLELGAFQYDYKFDLIVDGESYSANTKDWYGFTYEESYQIFAIVRKENELFPGRLTVTRKKSSRLYQ